MSESEPRPRVLVVDDRVENRVAVRGILEAEDCELVEADSGPAALRCLLRDDFAAVLLDAVMPGMDGFEVASLMRGRERTCTVPVLFMTAEASDLRSMWRGYQAGAVDYLVKPLQAPVVRAKVAVFLELWRQRERVRRQAEQLREAERREQEARLLALQLAGERRYRNLADAVPHIIWTADARGALTHANRRWYELGGAPDAQAPAGWEARVHPDDAPEVLAQWRRARETGLGLETECRLRTGADGAWRWHLCRMLPERAPDGTLVAWLGTFTDIDELRRSQEALREFKRTLDAVLDAVWFLDPGTGAFLYVNEGACRLTGREARDLAGLRMADVVPELRGPLLEDLMAPLLDGTKASVSLETDLRRADGAFVPVELSLQLIDVRGGRVVSIVRDTSERRRAEYERDRLYQQALDAIGARDEFLSIASHELRTPLTSLGLHIDSALRGEAAAEDRTAARLRSARGQVDRLARLVDELLDLSRLNAGRLRLETEPADLVELVRKVVADHAEEAQRAGCPVRLLAPAPVAGRFDALRLEQVVVNLLINAVKYAPGAPIEISVAEAQGRARFAVRDGGKGIAPEDRERIFARFERAAGTRKPGLGLGLYISRQVVEAHGGTIRVESEPGAGTTFVVDLPLEAADAAAPAVRQAPAPRPGEALARAGA